MSDKTTHEDLQLQTPEDWQTFVANELRKGAGRMAKIEANLKQNTELTSELLSIFAACKGGFKVLGWIGTCVKWIAGLAAAVGVIATALGFKWPWGH